MAYDEGLAQRVREQLQHRDDLEEKRMFGGLCILLSRHMCCGILGDTLMARVGQDQYEACLSKPHAREMDFTGRSSAQSTWLLHRHQGSAPQAVWRHASPTIATR